MEKIKTIVVLLLSLSIFAFPGCSRERRRGPLDVLRVTYVACGGDINHVEVFIITSDRKVTQYSIEPEPDKSYDYLAGELPSEDRYEVKEYEISELSWTSMVNVLTRVGFMNLKEDLSATGDICDAPTYYIKVETTDEVHTSGGYAAGMSDDTDNHNFAEAQQYILNALKGN